MGERIMKRVTTITLVGVMALLGSVACRAADAPATEGVKPAAEGAKAETTITQDGWRVLFNGKDLTGWKVKKKPEEGGPKVAEDGSLSIESHSGDVWTVDEFGDYILDLEFKLAKGAN